MIERQRRRERLYWSSQRQSEERGMVVVETDRPTETDREMHRERDRGGRGGGVNYRLQLDSLFVRVTANQVCIFTSSPRPNLV